MPPRVSVLLPARDAAATLAPCLRSLRRQTLRAWECVVVDDGSSDATARVAAAVAALDRRVRVYSTPARGLVAALDAGLAACRGRYVARMDADDLMHRTRLARQVDLLDRAPHLAAVGTHVRLFPRTGLSDGLRAYESWLNGIDTPARLRAEAFVECPVAHPTLCIRRDVLVRHGYRDPGWPEDYDLVLRLLGAGLSIGIVPARLHAWRDGPARLTRTHPRYALDRFAACKAAHLSATFLDGGDDYLLWGYGDTGRRLARALAACGKRPSHVIELHPGRIGNRIAGARVVTPDTLRTLARGRLVVSVAGPGPRAEIRTFLATLGWRDTIDFVCAA